MSARNSIDLMSEATLHWSPLNPTVEDRKTFAAGMDGMKPSWGGTMDQLAEYLATVRQPRRLEDSPSDQRSAR